MKGDLKYLKNKEIIPNFIGMALLALGAFLFYKNFGSIYEFVLPIMDKIFSK